eukprot:12890594-Alexandrium_andersonii.AAC.1
MQEEYVPPPPPPAAPPFQPQDGQAFHNAPPMRGGAMLMHFADEVGPGEEINAAWATFSGEAFHIFQNCRGLDR